MTASVAYLDTSAAVAILFDEPAGRAMARRLRGQKTLLASTLFEAELRSVASREALAPEALTPTLNSISWVIPDRPLTAELRIVLEHGYVRGADLWHLACALFVAPQAGDIMFLTLDDRQHEVARKLGFG